MTIAAALILDGFPVVLSDLLVTFTGQPAEQPGLALPAVGRVSALRGDRPKIRGLHQKVCVISGNIVLAMASNNIEHAIVGIAALRELARQRELTHIEVDAFLRSRVSLRSSAFVGFHASLRNDGNHWIERIQVNGNSFDGGAIGEVDAAGTGATLLETACRENRVTAEGFPLLQPHLRSLSKVASLCGLFTLDEMETGSSIINAFTGGAYEIVRFERGLFSKAELTFVIWFANLDDGFIDLEFPRLILKTSYEGDALLLHSARRDLSIIERRHWDVQSHAIPPSYAREVDAGSMLGTLPATFQSTLTQHLIVIEKGSQRETVSLVEPNVSGLRAGSGQDGFSVTVSGEMQHLLVGAIRRSVLASTLSGQANT